MRYSRARIITTTIISISCFIFVIFVIYKGIGYAKKANGAEEPEIKASVTEKKEVKKKVVKNTKKEVKKKSETKEVTKKTSKNKTETKTTEENQKTTTPVKQEPVKKQEIEKEEEGPTFDDSIVGKYVIKELTYEGKTYKKKEIEKLIKSGYSMNLEIKENGLAQLSVLSINHAYAVDDTYFSDGTNNIEYSHSSTRIRITVDNAKMLFVKK